MNRLKIAFLAGGDSSEREIALQSAAQIEAALDPGKYDVTVIDVRGRDWHYTAPTDAGGSSTATTSRSRSTDAAANSTTP